MHILDLVTILCLGLMIGNELAVSVFVNPALWRLEQAVQAQSVSLLARAGGKVMPFWYALCFVLLIAEAYMRRHSALILLLLGAIAIWVLAIVYSVAILVPMNNRIAQPDSGLSFPEWKSQHVQWDRLHRWRILMIVVAMGCFVWSVVAGA